MVFADQAAAGRSVRTEDVAPAERDRFSLSDGDVLELARTACVIEKHYGRPMDIEWGKDGVDGSIHVLQARPETVRSRKRAGADESFRLKGSGKLLVSGRAIGQKIGAGPVRIVRDASRMSVVNKGDVLVTDMTDPNWEPVMKLAAAIVTNRGGRTCHAAIIARELGIPAVVGCGDATARLVEGNTVTVSCAEGDTGKVYAGAVPFEVTTSEHGQMPRIPVKIAMNIGNPQLAFGFAQLPNAGVGLARLEFIINNEIGVHPKACIDWPELPDDLKAAVAHAARGYPDPRSFFCQKLVEGVATIAAAFWPKPVIVRLSDFKSNEYRKLIGGERYEPEEENPMLGLRGAARYDAATVIDATGAPIDGKGPIEATEFRRIEMIAKRKQIQEGLERLELWVEDRTLYMVKMRLVYPGGAGTKTIELSNLIANVPVEDEEFRVELPSNPLHTR